ncbi:MAG: glycoside hydrolase family 30 beta sandwich domain-containing protein [Velocimicrobium sp.]
MKVKYVMTTYDGEIKTEVVKEVMVWEDKKIENELINLYPQVEYQRLEGFGGAITESAGFVYSQMNKEQKKKLLKTYFSKEAMKYCMVRIPIDSCDFSLEHYEAMSDALDVEMKSFQLKRLEKYIFPLLEDAQKEYGSKIPIMLTPWSPPSFMKTNGERNNGGRLKKEYRSAWAEYICHYVEAFQERGYLVGRLSIQNEPNAVQTWDSCVFNGSEEKEFLRDFLYPSMKEHGLSDIEIFIWDHNKERVFERACEIIDEKTDGMIKGVAFHWYSGDHFEALRMVHEKFPDKKLILSEACIEYSKFSKNDGLKNAQKYAHDLMGNLNNGMSSFYDWNLVLDETGGPNHVGNYCEAPFLYDTIEHTLEEKNTAIYLWHFSHFIKKDAVRIGLSRYTQAIEAVAFKNLDESIVVILLNTKKERIPLNLRLDHHCVRLSLEPESIVSVEIIK